MGNIHAARALHHSLHRGLGQRRGSAALSGSLVRLHVVAVSDDTEEQAIKLRVRRQRCSPYLEAQARGRTGRRRGPGADRLRARRHPLRCRDRRRGARGQRHPRPRVLPHPRLRALSPCPPGRLRVAARRPRRGPGPQLVVRRLPAALPLRRRDGKRPRDPRGRQRSAALRRGRGRGVQVPPARALGRAHGVPGSRLSSSVLTENMVCGHVHAVIVLHKRAARCHAVAARHVFGGCVAHADDREHLRHAELLKGVVRQAMAASEA